MSDRTTKASKPSVHANGGGREKAPISEWREVDAEQLFLGANALLIRHGSERYTLRRTSKGKLILTK